MSKPLPQTQATSPTTTTHIWTSTTPPTTTTIHQALRPTASSLKSLPLPPLKPLTIPERIQALQNSPEVMRMVRESLSQLTTPTWTRKSTLLSNQLRTEANDYYRKRTWTKALRGFSLSLCYAPKGTKEEVLALGNRSAAAFHSGNFQAAIFDAERALALISKFSPAEENDCLDLKGKLQERILKCRREKLLESKDQENPSSSKTAIFTLPERNPEIPSAARFVRIADNPERGRHVVVEKDVNPGELLILEKPYAAALVNEFRWEMNYCHGCYGRIQGEGGAGLGVPCGGCVFAIFCSDACSTESSKDHKFLCDLSSILCILNLDRLVLLSFKTVLKVMMGGGLIDKCSVFSKERKESPEKHYYDSANYETTLPYLIYHEDNLTEEELVKYTLDAILLTELIKSKNPPFKDELTIPSLLLLHQLNYPCNAHSLNFLEFNNGIGDSSITTATLSDHASGAFPLLSLINHSCNPNVTRVTVGPHGLNGVVAIRGIPKGGELLDNYGAHFALEKREERRKHLRGFYGFVCSCEACEGDWPLIGELEKREEEEGFGGEEGRDEEFEGKVQEFEQGYNALVNERDGLQAVELLKPCLKYFECSNLAVPNTKLCYAQETFKQALNFVVFNSG